jgi:hypothetical protein
MNFYTVVNAITAGSTKLYAGTQGLGVWQRPLADIVVAVPPSTPETPEAFVLEQNYPNPFNPATAICFQLPVASGVRLVVYDLLGREVSILANERKPPGVHSVQFDATGLASGVYVYRLTAGDFVQARRMILVR